MPSVSSETLLTVCSGRSPGVLALKGSALPKALSAWEQLPSIPGGGHQQCLLVPAGLRKTKNLKQLPVMHGSQARQNDIGHSRVKFSGI